MNTSIKEYKQILIIELKDWQKLRTEKTMKEFMNYQKNAWDILLIDWVAFNKYEFKKAYEENIDWIESYIISLPKDIQKKVRERETEKKLRVGRWFDSIDEIVRFINSLDNNKE